MYAVAVTRSHARSPLVVMDPDANEKEIESTSTLDAHRRGRRRRCGRAREKTRGDRVAMSSRRRGLAVSTRTASRARDAAIRRGARVRSIRAFVYACACVRGLTMCVCAPRRVRVFRLNSLEDAQGAYSRVRRGIRACREVMRAFVCVNCVICDVWCTDACYLCVCFVRCSSSRSWKTREGTGRR